MCRKFTPNAIKINTTKIFEWMNLYEKGTKKVSPKAKAKTSLNFWVPKCLKSFEKICFKNSTTQISACLYMFSSFSFKWDSKRIEFFDFLNIFRTILLHQVFALLILWMKIKEQQQKKAGTMCAKFV